MKEGRFREDLYFRLRVIPIALPPLRERREDIPLLIGHLMRTSGQPKKLTRKALKILMEYGWPGNIAELQHTIAQMVVLSEGEIITENDIPQELLATTVTPNELTATVTIPPSGIDLKSYLYGLEKAFYQRAMELKGGNHAAAARLLGIAPHTFRKRARETFRL